MAIYHGSSNLFQIAIPFCIVAAGIACVGSLPYAVRMLGKEKASGQDYFARRLAIRDAENLLQKKL
eukprot:TRINITY_DN120_c0_g1_i2.p2 TRINITY_DN120_c0_g1~~TRINITY_DN120_c0_g1_i2.p2  ORF type:complete len:66 (+),score=9.44 TRINITY_DN120_c0_g1_i2:52-249(+)